MNTQDLLFRLLRVELGVETISNEEVENLKKEFGDEQKQSLYLLAKAHDVCAMVASALIDSRVLEKGDSYYNEFRVEISRAVFRYENQNYETARIKELFEIEGVDYLFLKGATLRGYYNKPYQRTSCDIDVLVKKDALERAKCLLVDKLGFVVDKEKGYHDVTLLSPSKVMIELHFSIKEDSLNADKVLEKAWDFATSVGNTHEYVFSNEFICFYHVAHAAYHFLSGGCGIKPFIDVYQLTNNANIDQNYLRDLLERCELMKFAIFMSQLSKAWFENSPKNKTLLLAEDYILVGGCYGLTSSGVALKRVKKGGKVNYLIGRLFLPYEKLKLKYPVLEKHKWLTPFCQVARWCSALFKKKGAKELSVMRSITDDKKEELKYLIDNLGL